MTMFYTIAIPLIQIIFVNLCFGNDESPNDSQKTQINLSNEAGKNPGNELSLNEERNSNGNQSADNDENELMVLSRQIQNQGKEKEKDSLEKESHLITKTKEHQNIFELPTALNEFEQDLLPLPWAFDNDLLFLSEQIQKQSEMLQLAKSNEKVQKTPAVEKRQENGKAKAALVDYEMVAQKRPRLSLAQTSGTYKPNWPNKIASLVEIFLEKSNKRWQSVNEQVFKMLYEECNAKQQLLIQMSGFGFDSSLFNDIESDYKNRSYQLTMAANFADAFDLAIAISTKIFWISKNWDQEEIDENFDRKMRQVTCGLVSVKPMFQTLMEHINSVQTILLNGGANDLIKKAEFCICTIKDLLRSVPLPTENEMAQIMLINLHLYIHFYRAMEQICAKFDNYPIITEQRKIILKIISRLGAYQQFALSFGHAQLKSEVCSKTKQ